jgi:5-methylcytosine-specific restriction endonuclease McrA
VLFAKQNGICPGCFRPIESAEIGEVDHATPLSRGGQDQPSNLLLMHALCNRDKHKKTLPEYWEWRVKVRMDDENLGRKHGLISISRR